jgi:type II secretory pathway pseudopilin PulG
MSQTSRRLDLSSGGRGPNDKLIAIGLAVVVFLSLALSLALLVPWVVGRRDQAKAVTATATIQLLQSACELYSREHGSLASESGGLESVIAGISVPIDPALLVDPWGNRYVYKVNNGCFSITSSGGGGQTKLPSESTAIGVRQCLPMK